MDCMKYRFLGNSGLKVSEICLGTMTFGEKVEGPKQCTEAESHEILDRFTQLGGNFIDTSNIYGSNEGLTEKIIGKWLCKQQRESLVVATKVRWGSRKHVNAVGLSRHHVILALNESLERLQTSYVDLYQTHHWDSGVPVEETLSALNDLVREGKVRYVGLSNLTGWQIQKMALLCKYNNWAPIVSYQPQWSLLARETEYEMVDLCRNEGIGVIPWSPLKGGWLSGKLKRGMNQAPEGSRIAWASEKEGRARESHPSFEWLNNEQAWNVLDLVENIAKQQGRSMAQVAIKWLLQKDIVSSVIIGAKSTKQLEDNMGASGDWSLTKDQMDDLDQASEPYIPYPYKSQRAMNRDRDRFSKCQ